MIRHKLQSNKTSDLPIGVSRYVEVDKTICFNVLVYENAKMRIKHFRVTKGMEEKFVKKSAINFRKYYEQCETTGATFHFDAFDDWQNPKSLCHCFFE